MENKSITIPLPSYVITRDWLYAPRTYLTDSFSPFVEEIYLPQVATKAGAITLYYQFGELAFSTNSCFKKIKTKFKSKQEVVSDILLDLRANSPSNIAHALTMHLPIALYATDFLRSINHAKPLLIFPENLPFYIQAIFTNLGYRVLLTDSVLTGQVCEYEIESLIFLRGVLPKLIKDSLEHSDFARKLLAKEHSLPKKLFISRRDTRRLINEQEIEMFLAKKGYKKIFLEDYDVLDQLAMVALADSIVAIHGAALGPIIFRRLFKKNELKLVELFTPAHMTNVYRIIMHQIGGKWVGVRGKVSPKLAKQAYECPPDKVRQYSLEDFEVCLESLGKAMLSLNL